MRSSDRLFRVLRKILPTPFTIAVLLTVVTFFAAFGLTGRGVPDRLGYLYTLVEYWEGGLWKSGLLVFAVQMMLMLVLGHVLALTAPIAKLIGYGVRLCTNTARAAFWVTLLTILVSLFNWGLGLIFGAIFARKVGEFASRKGIALNYPLIGAAGYVGLMVWHGGMSGSALIKAAEPNNLRNMMEGAWTETQLASLPETLPFDSTVFSGLNLVVTLLLVLVLPLAMYILGKRSHSGIPQLRSSSFLDQTEQEDIEIKSGAEKLDYSRWFGPGFGVILLLFVLLKMQHLIADGQSIFGFFIPNNINLLLLGLGLALHRNISAFLKAIEEAIGGTAGILIQFPLYFGIMGLVSSSGMVNLLATTLAQSATATTFPIFTFFSAGLINIFVPSGGGQWVVQGPIVIEAAAQLGVPLSKSVLALAYGDQLTNMLQPFWALPLLGITGLKAKEILPYTLFLMVIGAAIFLSCLLIF